MGEPGGGAQAQLEGEPGFRGSAPRRARVHPWSSFSPLNPVSPAPLDLPTHRPSSPPRQPLGPVAPSPAGFPDLPPHSHCPQGSGEATSLEPVPPHPLPLLSSPSHQLLFSPVSLLTSLGLSLTPINTVLPNLTPAPLPQSPLFPCFTPSPPPSIWPIAFSWFSPFSLLPLLLLSLCPHSKLPCPSLCPTSPLHFLPPHPQSHPLSLSGASSSCSLPPVLPTFTSRRPWPPSRTGNYSC